MLSKPLRKRLAKRIVESMNMKEDETLRISAGLHTHDLVENIAIEAMKAGVQPSFTTTSDDYTKAVYEHVPEKYLGRTSKLGMKMVEALDNTLRIESPKDPRIMENIPQHKIAAVIQGNRPIRKKMDGYEIKWCYAGFATEEMAAKLGISFNLLKKFIFDGMLIEPKKLYEPAKIIKKTLAGAKFVHITDEYGTNLTLRMANRKIKIADGLIDDDDIRQKDIGLNLPDGEVFTTALETEGGGILVSPKRTDVLTGKMIENIRLVFEKGKLNLQKTTAEKNEALLKNTIKHFIAIDKKNEKEIRTTHFAELGIGLNPLIDRIIGYLLTDEKIGGTIHVAIGMNKDKAYGGANSSALHWDFITHKGVNVEVTYANGRSAALLENGKVAVN
ncbi:MAG: aminopeptidase [Candidatus Aenigmarchaeota archaeon]|nr:aminopeptidase [Candidatus Aenigmarchaeota archaeon]